MVQETRQATDPEAFPYTAEDLRLPLRLFELRKQYPRDDEVNATLDTVFDAILAGDLEGARATLDDVASR
jgi:hypothetical protein